MRLSETAATDNISNQIQCIICYGKGQPRGISPKICGSSPEFKPRDWEAVSNDKLLQMAVAHISTRIFT